jgi:autotransporter-associated beta strand protein
MKTILSSLTLFLTLTGLAPSLRAGSATWNLNPTSSDWNDPLNWTPNTVPDGPNDIATFGLSNQTDITVSTFGTEVNELIFSPGASAFTINVTEGKTFTISGTGIMNNSGFDQNFVVAKASEIELTNSATAGDLTFFTLLGATELFGNGGQIFFLDTSSAGHGIFVVNAAANNVGNGAAITFLDNATAANGTFTAKAGSQSNVASGIIVFGGTATGGDGSFTIEGAGTGAAVVFAGSDAAKPTAGNGIFNINGSSVSGGLGGFAQFSGGTAGSATFITNSGNGGGGGYITFLSNDESEARFELFGGALYAEYAGGDATVSVGSIEGNALIGLSALGANQKLITGSNDLSTTFSGTITDLDAPRTSGSLEKIGNGTLTLSGANTYDGGTTIEGGNLLINNRAGSATGKGLVQVNAGGLGGRGTIAGAVVVGEGSGFRAALVPRRRGGKPDTLTIESQLTFNSDGSYRCKLNTKSGVASKVVANGVVINAAQFSLLDCCGLSLSPGTVLTVIDNTSANPISGTFANLPDGGTITVGSNTFQANYEGGDGNDLILTVF